MGAGPAPYQGVSLELPQIPPPAIVSEAANDLPMCVRSW